MSRVTRAALAAGMMWLAGCDSEEKEARKPWDGSYTPLEEKGDWQDTGPYSACKAPLLPENACNSTPEHFDVSACRTETLAGLEHEGVFRGIFRMDSLSREQPPHNAYGNGFQFGPEGTPVRLRDMTPSTWTLDDGTFHVRAEYPGIEATVRYTLHGCESPAPGVLLGCFSSCIDERRSRTGTFIAKRMTWREGEPESSGGLKLLSESRVEPGMATDVFITQDHAYVVSQIRYGRGGGLTVFDVSDRRNPLFKASVSLPEGTNWGGVWAKGNTLYVASELKGVALFDISNPAEPGFRGYAPDVGGVYNLRGDGNRLYAMSRRSFVYILDVSTPASPQRIGGLSTLDFRSDTDWDGGEAYDASVHEGRLYVNESGGGLEVFDINDVKAPRRLGRYTFPGILSAASAVVTMGGHTLAFEGGETLGGHVRVLLMDDPANIVKIGEFKLRDSTALHTLVFKDERLYVAWYHEGVRVLDVSNPTQPRQLAHYNTYRDTDPGRHDGMFEGAISIRVPGDGYVYAVDTARGLLIFNAL